MTFFAEGRSSDAPYVDSIWRGDADNDHTLMCPADGRWNLCFTRLNGQVEVSIEGPLTQAASITHVKGVDWLVIKFKLGAFLSCITTSDLLDGEIRLPEAASQQSFWLGGSCWQLPSFENADTFVDWLVREQIVQFDPVIDAALRDIPQSLSARSVRHHFLQTIGLRQSHVRNIERARDAMLRVNHGVPILDVVHELGYADQPHLTRSIRRYMGYSPSEVTGIDLPF